MNSSDFVGVSGRSTKLIVNFFKCSERGMVGYLVMLELMPPQALNVVEMAVAGFISRVIRVLITLKVARHIKSCPDAYFRV